VRRRPGVADKCSVAEIAVFEGSAVSVRLAVAGRFRPLALAIRTQVGHGAWVSVVARFAVGRKFAAPGLGADIVGAGVVVIALHRRAQAGPLGALVRGRARVCVVARFAVGRKVAAAGFGADIVGAGVVVIAEIPVLSLQQGSFVGRPIAVVVRAVADFLDRRGSIAFEQPLLVAPELARADSPLV